MHIPIHSPAAHVQNRRIVYRFELRVVPGPFLPIESGLLGCPGSDILRQSLLPLTSLGDIARNRNDSAEPGMGKLVSKISRIGTLFDDVRTEGHKRSGAVSGSTLTKLGFGDEDLRKGIWTQWTQAHDSATSGASK